MDALGRSPKQIGAVIRKARRAKQLNQTQLSKRAGVRQATISKIENGEGAARISTICAVLAALDLELVIRPRTRSAAREIGDFF